MPERARAEVDRNLELLERQVEEANRRLVATRGQGGPNFVQNAVLGPLRSKRVATIERIAISIGRQAERPTGLEELAGCELTGDNGNQGNGGQGGNNGGQGNEDVLRDIGPVAEDFVDIRRVPVTRQPRVKGRNASRGIFVSRCGNNSEGHFNTDNIIISPGVPNGAEHLHDYVGNVDADFASTDESLGAADTTCANKADQSTYFWPVLRVRSQNDAPGAPEKDRNNVGTSVLPKQVLLEYRGNAVSKVEPMPRFIRLFSGDAKTITNGTANARPTWSCTGFTNRITDKYPICPRGSRVVRIVDMPSCWDGCDGQAAGGRLRHRLAAGHLLHRHARDGIQTLQPGPDQLGEPTRDGPVQQFPQRHRVARTRREMRRSPCCPSVQYPARRHVGSDLRSGLCPILLIAA